MSIASAVLEKSAEITGYAKDWPDEDEGKVADEKRRFRFEGIVQRLTKEANDRVTRRYEHERRWLEDLRQYHGKYADKIVKNLAEANRSELFLNITRPKTLALVARLFNMLFPTDDRNWGIQPTKVPSLAGTAQSSVKEALAMKQQAQQAPAGTEGAMELAQQAETIETLGAELKAEMDEATKRSDAMGDVIEDQLTECSYASEVRKQLTEGGILGTGVMKGPIVNDKPKRRWEAKLKEGGAEYSLGGIDDPRPMFRYVDLWHFFPDMEARTMEECTSVYERHLYNAKAMRDLAKRKGFDKDAIRRILTAGSRESTPQFITDLRSITGIQTDTTADMFTVWEYHGPLEPEEVRLLAERTGKTELAAEMQEADPLKEVYVSIWFCQSEVLKFGDHPMDSGESLYSVFNLEKDPSSIFGFGVPYIMRDPQKALNGAWRMLMDNAGLSTGPQMEIDPEVIAPADNVWAITPRKLWLRKSGAQKGVPGISVYNIDGHQAELSAIIQMAFQFGDIETSISQMAQGEQGTSTTKTAQGMSLLMNSTNVIFGRIVKNFDDDCTVPNIRRIYDFNMQFSPRDDIKGDFDVDARGSSVLLVREMQAQNLMAMALSFSAHPTLGPWTKVGPLYRRLVQAHNLPADEIVMTEQEWAEQQAAAAKAGPPPDYDKLKLENQMEIARMDRETTLEVARMERETKLQTDSETLNVKREDTQVKAADKDKDRQSKERQFAAEAALTARNGPSGGGSF